MQLPKRPVPDRKAATDSGATDKCMQLQSRIQRLKHHAVLRIEKQSQLQQKLEAQSRQLREAHEDLAIAQAVAAKRFDILISLQK